MKCSSLISYDPVTGEVRDVLAGAVTHVRYEILNKAGETAKLDLSLTTDRDNPQALNQLAGFFNDAQGEKCFVRFRVGGMTVVIDTEREVSTAVGSLTLLLNIEGWAMSNDNILRWERGALNDTRQTREMSFLFQYSREPYHGIGQVDVKDVPVIAEDGIGSSRTLYVETTNGDFLSAFLDGVVHDEAKLVEFIFDGTVVASCRKVEMLRVHKSKGTYEQPIFCFSVDLGDDFNS